MILFMASASAMGQIVNFTNTTDFICNRPIISVFGEHTKYEYLISGSTFTLPSCGDSISNKTIYWFWYEDVCNLNTCRGAQFVRIYPNSTVACVDSPGLNITYYSCQNDYNFTRESMTIRRMSDYSSQKYICFQWIDQAFVMNSSATVYVVDFLGKYI